MNKPVIQKTIYRKKERTPSAEHIKQQLISSAGIPNIETIGKNIRKYRVAKKMRQEDLAEKTGLSSNYIGMLERGEKIPALETFIRILNVLEVSADLVLMDVLHTGYTIKQSLLDEKLSQVSPEDRETVYGIIELFVTRKR